MHMFQRFVSVLALGCASAGCAPDGFPEYGALDRLRVLSVVASPPQAQPGQTVQITPLLSDPQGEGAALTWTLSTCTDPGIAQGADPTCLGAADRKELVTQTLTLTAPHYTEAPPPVDLAIPSDYLSDLSSDLQLVGRTLLVEGKVVRGDSSITFIKRVPVRLASSMNQNPSLEALVAAPSSEGEEAVVTPDGTLARPSHDRSITPRLSVGAEDGETLTMTWFASQGTWNRTRTESTASNTFTPPTTWTSGASIWVVVVRDGQGGEAFQRILLE